LRPRELYVLIILAILIGDSLIIFAEQEEKLYFANLVLNINSSIAASLAIYVTIKEKNSNNNLNVNMLLVVGLVLWFLANIVWAYYEVFLHLMAPVPSLADLLLFSAYSILTIRLLIEYKSLTKKPGKKFIGIVAIIIIVFLTYIFTLTLDLSVLSTARGQLMFAVTIVYPVFNSILSFMAIIILYGLKNEKEKEKRHEIAWSCELIGFLVIVLGDSWFAIIVLTEFVEQLWISALLLSAHYIMIAGGLLWYIGLANKSNHHTLYYSIKNNFNKRKKTVVISSVLILIMVISIAIYLSIGFNHIDDVESSSAKTNFEMKVPNKYNKVPIGLITSLTGAWSSGGKSIKIAVQEAEKDVNDYLDNKNSSIRVKLLIENSKTDPVETVKAVKRLTDSGVKIVVGPATSAAVMAVKDYAVQNDVILLSPSSTSPALSIFGDNLFRFVPDDTNQAEFISNKMWDDGIRVVVPMWRADTFGNELVKSMKENFERKGGVVLDGVQYYPHTGEFASSLHRINFIMWNQYLKKLSNIVENTTQSFAPGKVGVYLASFDEVTPILIQSNEHEILHKVKWYGSDASAQNLQIIRNHDAADFAQTTNFSNPLFHVDLNNKTAETVGAVIEKKLHGSTSLTYPTIAYDTFWIAALSLEKIANNMTDEIDVDNLKKVIISTASLHNGISGNTVLNDAGDRINANYDIWSVTKSNLDTDQYIWRHDIN
jgi:branched-chain amino acid transport system substrate-binding protein